MNLYLGVPVFLVLSVRTQQVTAAFDGGRLEPRRPGTLSKVPASVADTEALLRKSKSSMAVESGTMTRRRLVRLLQDHR